MADRRARPRRPGSRTIGCRREGPDLFGNIYTDLDLDSDRYIKAIQTRVPDNASRRVVHHALSFAVDPGEQQMREAGETDIPAAMFLVEYASGKQSEIYPENSGLLLESWRRMRLDYHLHSVGEDIDAKVELGMVFHPGGACPRSMSAGRSSSASTSPTWTFRPAR